MSRLLLKVGLMIQGCSIVVLYSSLGFSIFEQIASVLVCIVLVWWDAVLMSMVLQLWY